MFAELSRAEAVTRVFAPSILDELAARRACSVPVALALKRETYSAAWLEKLARSSSG